MKLKMYIVSRKSKKRKIILLIKNLKTLNCLTIKNYTKKNISRF